MTLVVLLVVVGVLFVSWWWRSLAAFARSVDSYRESVRGLALAAQRGAAERRPAPPAMAHTRLRVWSVEVRNLTHRDESSVRRK